MKTRMFQQLDPRENRLPADVSRTIKKVPHRTVPLVNPNLFVSRHPGISKLLAKIDPVNPKTIRMEQREIIVQRAESANRMIKDSIHYKAIKFDVDDATGRSVAVVRDRATGDVLKQMPSAEMLNMAARLREASGLLDMNA